MTRECTLKDAFISKLLDEFQPGWRNGEDVTWVTKKKIQQYTAEKYPELFTKEGAECLSIISLNEALKRLRKKLDIHAKRANKNSGAPVPTWQSAHKLQEGGENSLNNLCGANAPHQECPTCHEEKSEHLEEKQREIELVTISCSNPECDKFALVTREDKRFFMATQPLKKDEVILPYCSDECQQAHATILSQL